MNRRFIQLGLTGVIWAWWASFNAWAADDIPATIAAFSTPALQSEVFYSDMGAKLEAAPGDPFDVKLLIRGELGSDEAHFYALRRGRVQIVGVGFQSIATAVPELTVLNGAYLFDNWDEVDFIYETAVTPYVNALLEDYGIKGIVYFAAAWHGLYATQPIHVPEDVAGRRFRALIDPSSQVFVRALNADMFQIPMTDVVTSLQTGLIEGGDTNSHVYTITGTSTEAPYFTRTRHTPTVIAVIANKRWWDGLTPEQQNIVGTAHPPMRVAGAALRADEERMLAAAEEDHATMIEPSAEGLAAWRKVGLSTHLALIEAAGGRAQELYDVVMEAKQAYQRHRQDP